ncbi:hypothetical protein PROFUN_04331 [Planoprotostelium fungivorum]|uniref:Pirin n=1 Tax=Planoprotostelium fungivorum TaxID=1890364 RepID=A0A2P6NV65_9EUKA|nr:hypothetical protein PROFUN_04331 [Planoprotostelium fungivorum]
MFSVGHYFLFLILSLSKQYNQHKVIDGDIVEEAQLRLEDKKEEMTTNVCRSVKLVLAGRPMKEGAGVTIRRTIGTPKLDYFDPFLMLDEFNNDDPKQYMAGFPEHPHRGFETVTYMLEGRMLHQGEVKREGKRLKEGIDHKGNKGLLGPGSVQWMTAGRGIIHSEMPQQQEGKMHGFQFWVNLPAKDKMIPPRYQDYQADQIPIRETPFGKIKIMAGEYEGTVGAVNGITTNPLLFDVTLEPNQKFEHAVPQGHNIFCYNFAGEGHFGPEGQTKAAGEGVLVAFEKEGDHIQVRAGDKGARFIMAAAMPMNEPMARYGPFVMNTQKEIQQAFVDFQSGRF